eukprot:CAMPEP_0117448176 /NCGR_PEP_ID=MMETSP0759-20121206/7263_1 /TAXON_ID=63605 /ORGANISM="Percolomonas cosmopolitus, Strain WS" /LENGTH=540 /DNA_ID=CAMNT_0005240549 /DNA_START=58 /DNA_END=1677 /DNA_ORIENTATION=+
MTTPLITDFQTTTIRELKTQFLPKHQIFTQKDEQEIVDDETHAQLTAPRQRTLATEIISRAELVSYAKGINEIRKRIMGKYHEGSLNPNVSLEEAIWNYVQKEYPVEEAQKEASTQEDSSEVVNSFSTLSPEDQRRKVYCEIMNLNTFSNISPVEFQFVKSGEEYARMLQRQVPQKELDSHTRQLVQKVTSSNNIPNAIHTISQYIDADAEDETRIDMDDNRMWIQMDLETPAMWNRDAVLDNPPHKLLSATMNRVAVICKDDKVKQHVQEEIIFDQAFAFQFLTFTEVKRNFTKPTRFRALVQSYDIVLMDSEVIELFRILKLSEHFNLFTIDFSKGRPEYERIMNGIPFRILDCKERLRIDFGFQSWEESQLVDNCRFAVQQLAHHTPWGFSNVKCLHLSCGKAPQLCIYKRDQKVERSSKLFRKSVGLVPDNLKNRPYVRYAPKTLEELPEETNDPMLDLIAQETEKQQAEVAMDEGEVEAEVAKEVVEEKPALGAAKPQQETTQTKKPTNKKEKAAAPQKKDNNKRKRGGDQASKR